MSARRLSVVITSHDYGRFLGDAIRSALDQVPSADEVIVVDDGSTDDSRAVMAGFGDRITALYREHGGQAAALNAGLRRATGDVVVLLDADDVLEPGALASFLEAAEDGVARIQARVVLEGAGGEAGLVPGGPLPTVPARDLVLRTGGYPATGTTGSALTRPALAALLPIPDEQWRRNPDTYLMLLAPFVGRVAWVDAVAGRVRVHGANQWSALEVSAERLRDYVDCDIRKEALLRARAAALGFEAPREGWLLRSTAHIQSRLALLRLDRTRHPFDGDSALALALRGVASAMANDGYSPRKRLMLSAWFLAVAIAPAGLAERLIVAAYSRTARPRWASTLLGRVRREHASRAPSP